MKLLRALFLPFALGLVGIIRFVSRWKLIRFGEMWSGRLGHLVGNTECYLCEKDALKQPDAYDIFFPVGGISHRVIFRKYAKILHTWPAWICLPLMRLNMLFHGWEKHIITPAQLDRDIYNLGRTFSPHIGFTQREEKKGQKLLRKIGIPEGAKWVCFIVRDAAYLKVKNPTVDFSYHDYRDADVSNYIPAAVELARRGYYVVRMGEIVAKPMYVRHSRIIDYALGKPSDFATLYLGAKCAFCLGTSTGFMAIPQAFNRPIVLTDFVPLEYAPTWSSGLMIWKHHLKDGKRMTVKEILDSGLGLTNFGQVFAESGVTLENNTAQEIFDVAVEIAERERGMCAQTDQTHFWSSFRNSVVNGKPLHGQWRLRVGSEFLKGYS